MSWIGAVIIGCGKVASAHAQAYLTLNDADFIGVYSNIREQALSFADQYQVRAFKSLEEMLNRPEVSVASICTPHTTHPEIVAACARAGVHALVEKPMAVDLKGCDLAIRSAEQASIKLGVISQRRFYEPVKRVKEAIENGKIGCPILATVTVMGWRDQDYYQMDPWRGQWATEGGGVLLTQTTHQMDLFQWFMGPIEEVFGYWANLNHPYMEVEDTAVAVVRFKSGALGTILMSNSQNPGFYGKIHVHGENGASVGVQTDGGSPFISGVTQSIDPPINDIWTIPGEEDKLAKWQKEDMASGQIIDATCYYHYLQIEDFLQAIIHDRQPAVDGHEGRKHVELFSAIYRSQRDRHPVKFPLNASIGSEDFDGRLATTTCDGR